MVGLAAQAMCRNRARMRAVTNDALVLRVQRYSSAVDHPDRNVPDAVHRIYQYALPRLA